MLMALFFFPQSLWSLWLFSFRSELWAFIENVFPSEKLKSQAYNNWKSMKTMFFKIIICHVQTIHILLRRMVRNLRAYGLKKKSFSNNLYHHIIFFVRLPAFFQAASAIALSCKSRRFSSNLRAWKISAFLEETKT